MVSSSFTSPSYSRVPGLMDRLEELRNRPDLIRQLALLAVVVAAGALLLALPQPTQDPVTIAALSDDEADETTQNEEASGPTTDESDDGWLGRDEPDSDADGERFAMIAGFGAAANNMADLGADASNSESTTTTSSSTTALPTTAAPTTQAPTTAAPAATDGASGDSTEPADPESGTSESETTDTETAELDGESESDSDPAEVPDETAGPENEEAVEQPAPTTSTTVVADNGYVDAGHGVMVPPVLLKIRFCESTDNYSAANPASSARGAYQFLTGSWAAYGHAERYGVSRAHLASPAQQDEAALITWQADGTRPWLASKHCWG